MGALRKKALLRINEGGLWKNPGGVLLSHTVTHVVPSAQEGLTSVFEMGTGVTPPLSPPKTDQNDNSYLQLLNEENYGQAARPISTSKLNPLLDLHLWPINLVVYKGSLAPVSPPERDI